MSFFVYFLTGIYLFTPNIAFACWEELTPLAERASPFVKAIVPGYFDEPIVKPNSFEDLEKNHVVKEEVNRQLEKLGQSPPPPEGKTLDKLVVVTHQFSEWQASTAELLASPKFQGIPSLILASEAFQVTDQKLAHQASFFEYSTVGALDYRSYAAKEVTFIGGNAMVCMSYSVESIVEEAERRGMKEITFRFIMPYIYGYSDAMEAITKGQSAVSAQMFFTALKKNMLRILFLGIPDIESFRQNGNVFKGDYKTQAGLIIHIEVEK